MFGRGVLHRAPRYCASTHRMLTGRSKCHGNALPALCIAKLHCEAYCLILIAVTLAICQQRTRQRVTFSFVLYFVAHQKLLLHAYASELSTQIHTDRTHTAQSAPLHSTISINVLMKRMKCRNQVPPNY